MLSERGNTRWVFQAGSGVFFISVTRKTLGWVYESSRGLFTLNIHMLPEKDRKEIYKLIIWKKYGLRW